MRVIAGTAKGTRLAPVPPGVRPVSDRVREGVFSSLAADVPDARVLDLYAGTGALGIEALSRGASHATLVEQAPGAVATIRENLTRTRLGDRAIVVRSEVGRFLEREREQKFDVVFLDPPYALGGPIEGVLGRLGAGGLLSDRATVVLTRASRDPTLVVPIDWSLAKRLAYGDSVLTLYRSPSLPGATGE